MIYWHSQISCFVILMQGGRVGSSYLTSALDSHPDVRAYGELLVGLSHQEQEQVYHHVLRPRLISRKRATGFKTKLTDIVDEEQFAKYLRKRQVKVVVLTRENLVKLVVSWINSERLHAQTGRYQSRPDIAGITLPPLIVEMEDFRRRLKQVESQRRRFLRYAEGLEVQKLTLSYEQMFSVGSDCIARVLSFLNVRPLHLKSRVRKVTPDNLREAIANFDELEWHLAGTHYGSMLGEAGGVEEASVLSEGSCG